MVNERMFFVAWICLFFTGTSSGQFTHVGVAAGYGTRINEPGFGAYGIYSFSEEIKIAANVMYYLPHEVSTDNGTQKFSWWTISLDGHYVLVNQRAFRFYGIVGLTFVSLTGEQDEVISGQPFEDKLTIQKLGLNIGTGIRFPVTEIMAPFVEVKFTLGNAADFEFRNLPVSQFSLAAGIMFRISETKTRDHQEE